MSLKHGCSLSLMGLAHLLADIYASYCSSNLNCEDFKCLTFSGLSEQGHKINYITFIRPTNDFLTRTETLLMFTTKA